MALEAKEARSVLVESCVKNIHRQENAEHSPDKFVINYVTTTMAGTGNELKIGRSNTTLRYDNNHPEVAMRMESIELPPMPADALTNEPVQRFGR